MDNRCVLFMKHIYSDIGVFFLVVASNVDLYDWLVLFIKT